MVDTSMSKDYRARRKREGYAAICALGFEEDRGVFCLASTEDVEKLLPRFQLGTWHRLHFRYLVWTPGLVLARTLVCSVENRLPGRLGHHWYRSDLGTLEKLIAAESKRMRATMWTNDQLTDRIRDQLNREADRFAEGIF